MTARTRRNSPRQIGALQLGTALATTLFAGPATALVPVLRTGEAAPGGGFYGLYDDHSFSDGNQVIFRSRYNADNPPMTTYVGSPGAIQVPAGGVCGPRLRGGAVSGDVRGRVRKA